MTAQLPAGQTNADRDCLPPLTTFAFPYGETSITPPPQEQVLPPSEWKLVSTMPKFDRSAGFNLELIHSDNQYSEFWVLTNNQQGLFQYRTDTEQWTINKTADVSTASRLFLDKKGNIWSVRAGYYGPFDLQPFLSRYDKRKGEFIPVYNIGDTWTLTVSSVKVDENGIFWMMVKKRGVYQLLSFDPLTVKATLHLESPDYRSSLEISPDNKILFVDQKNNNLIAYTPNTSNIDSYNIPVALDLPVDAELYFDNSGRLWINDVGWFDFSTPPRRQWFTIVRSPIFIDVVPGAGQWGWGRPTFINESPDGFLWYVSSRGTGWLDTKNGTWCLFTTYTSNVLEDREHNLWILADGKLFRRDTSP